MFVIFERKQEIFLHTEKSPGKISPFGRNDKQFLCRKPHPLP